MGLHLLLVGLGEVGEFLLQHPVLERYLFVLRYFFLLIVGDVLGFLVLPHWRFQLSSNIATTLRLGLRLYERDGFAVLLDVLPQFLVLALQGLDDGFVVLLLLHELLLLMVFLVLEAKDLVLELFGHGDI